MRHLLIKKRFQQAVWGILIKTEFIIVIQITYMFLYLPRVVRLSVYPPPPFHYNLWREYPETTKSFETIVNEYILYYIL